MEPIQSETFFGTRYVPLHAALDQIAGSVEWDNEAKRATVHADGKTALVTMTDTNVEVNGANVTISQPALVQYGILYVPEDFFQTVLGQTVTLA